MIGLWVGVGGMIGWCWRGSRGVSRSIMLLNSLNNRSTISMLNINNHLSCNNHLNSSKHHSIHNNCLLTLYSISKHNSRNLHTINKHINLNSINKHRHNNRDSTLRMRMEIPCFLRFCPTASFDYGRACQCMLPSLLTF
jgi:hypothetical protein